MSKYNIVHFKYIQFLLMQNKQKSSLWGSYFTGSSLGGNSQKPIRASLSTVYGPKRGFPGSSDGKESACNARDPALIPGSRRSPGEGNGNPLQYSCLENSMNRPWDHKELDS